MKKQLPPTELPAFMEKSIDKLDFEEGFKIMVNSQKDAVRAVQNANSQIKNIVNKIFIHVSKSKKSRIIYAGAGTSGRIGVQDGAELNPTFGWPTNRVEFIIAGGIKSLTKSIENAEDDINYANKKVNELQINSNDIVIAIAASGNTPFTLNVLKESEKRAALCVSIVNNPDADMLAICENNIILDTGPEVITGSTRLKAGTAQKICLNIISSLLMIRLGRVKNGEMNFLKANNIKLKERQKRIILKIKNE